RRQVQRRNRVRPRPAPAVRGRDLGRRVARRNPRDHRGRRRRRRQAAGLEPPDHPGPVTRTPTKRKVKLIMAELHTLSVLTLDEPGILVRIAGMFTRRGFSIQSITSGTTEVDGVNRITLVVETEDLPIEQITKQLNKLIPVLKVVRQPD